MRDSHLKAEFVLWVIATVVGALGVALAVVCDITYDTRPIVNVAARIAFLLLILASQVFVIAVFFARASEIDSPGSGSRLNFWMSVASVLLIVHMIWSTLADVYRPDRRSPISRTEIRISYIWLVPLAVGIAHCYSMIRQKR